MHKFSLYEKHVEALQLTTNQKSVLAKIVAAPTPKVAAEDISQGENIVAARDMLIELGFITFADGVFAALTASGKKIATDENIIDDTGALTDDGRQVLTPETDILPNTESYKLIKQLVNESVSPKNSVD
jgi:hypothetical protein